jgi:TetR/AcrR family transcriptional regulator, cholesterol catabolism regulator
VGNHRNHHQRVQHILRHAARVFREKGYEGASIRDISRASGVALSSLYYYYRSKQELLYRIQVFAFTRILERLEERLAGVRDPEERLRVLVRNHLDYFLEHPDEMTVMAHEDDSLAGEYGKEVAEIKRRYYRKALEVFEGLRRKGGVRRMSPRVAVLSLFGMMNWVYTWHRAQIDPGAEELAEMISSLFLHGVRPAGAGLAAASMARDSARTGLARLGQVATEVRRANS